MPSILQNTKKKKDIKTKCIIFLPIVNYMRFLQNKFILGAMETQEETI